MPGGKGGDADSQEENWGHVRGRHNAGPGPQLRPYVHGSGHVRRVTVRSSPTCHQEAPHLQARGPTVSPLTGIHCHGPEHMTGTHDSGRSPS